MSSLGLPYSTGTLSVTGGSANVVGVGTAWSLVIVEGDFLSADGLIGIVDTVTDDTHIILKRGWAGSTLSASDYDIMRMSPLRYEPALAYEAQAQVKALLEGSGLIRAVTGDAPDPGLGEDGQYALKTNTGAWLQWLKVSGSWVLQGTPIGLTYKGDWSSATAYSTNDEVKRSGAVYLCTAANTNQAPESSPSYWTVLGAKGDKGDTGSTGPVPVIAGTSTSSVSVAVGSKSFTTQAGLSFSAGMRVRAANSDSSRVMVGPVSSYSGTTLTITVDDITGTGTDTSWTLAIAGEKGGKGDTGSTGPLPTISGTSTSNVSVALGTKSFTTQSGIAFTAGLRIRAANSDNSKVMVGPVASYVGSTLTITVDDVAGVGGSDNAWTLVIAGEKGGKGDQGNTGGIGLQGLTGPVPIIAGTSTSSVSVGTGSKSFTTQTGLSLSQGMRTRVVNTDRTKLMTGTVTAYSGGTLTMIVDDTIGSGSDSAWTITIGGEKGLQGIQGLTGAGLAYSASGTLAERSTYDGQTPGFSYLETDVSPARFWVKASNTSADWAGPTYIGGAAAVGDLGSVTDSILETFDYGVAA